MARINIEDSLFRDSRYQDLILKTGSRWTALGMVTEAWYLAQEFFLNEDTGRMIPLDVWKKRKAPDAVIEVGLAEVKEGHVYVCGSSEQFNWLLEKTESGRRGGIASAQKRAQAKLKQNQAQLESASSTVQADSSEAQANASESNPLTLSLTHSLTQNKTNTAQVGASSADTIDFTKWLGRDNSRALSAQEKPAQVIAAGIKGDATVDGVIELYNQELAGTGKLKSCPGLGSKSIKELLNTFSHLPTMDQWSDLFALVKANTALTGASKTVFLATLDWLAVEDNALKVLSGKYDLPSDAEFEEKSIDDYIKSIKLG